MAKTDGLKSKKGHDGIIRVVVSPKQSIAPMAIDFFLGVSIHKKNVWKAQILSDSNIFSLQSEGDIDFMS